MSATARFEYGPYDLVKEAVIAVLVVAALAVGLTIVFSSPDLKPSTIATWSRSDPVDFVSTAEAELSGASGVAGYGPPYNHAADGQHAAFLYIQKWLGVTHPIDTAKDFVLGPLHMVAATPALTAALSTYEHASTSQQTTWNDAYTKDLSTAKASSDGSVSVVAADSGPVAPMMQSLLALAQSGGIDGALLTSPHFYQTDYTKPLLFLSDSATYFPDRAHGEHLLGTDWGMMNETGAYPGQVWLWLYTIWYQIDPFKSSHNADILVMLVMGVLSLAFVCIPFIPGIRDIPRAIPIYRLIWRRHYQTAGS